MAETLQEELGVQAALEQGSGGIFTIAVDGVIVERKTFLGFPGEDAIVRSVAKALG